MIQWLQWKIVAAKFEIWFMSIAQTMRDKFNNSTIMINDDKMFIFGQTVPLMLSHFKYNIGICDYLKLLLQYGRTRTSGV